MDTSGNTSIEQYAFNLLNVDEPALTVYIDDDGDCDTIGYDDGYHDIEIYNDISQDNILWGTGPYTNTAAFDLGLYANVSGFTIPSSYTLNLAFIITTVP